MKSETKIKKPEPVEKVGMPKKLQIAYDIIKYFKETYTCNGKGL